jgi:ABC-type branched-subunit amino acid transport system substrate-binding protein
MLTRSVVAVAALALLATACGSRVSNDNSQGSGSGGLSGGNTGITTGGGTGAAVTSFGSAPSPCGKADPSLGPLTDSDVGVTASEIKLATIADPGGPKPGLNKGMWDSMQAFADWCNAQGGILGRKLVVDLLDGKLLDYNSQVVQACANDFAMVGGLGVLDESGAQTGVDCGIPNIAGAAVSPQQTEAENTVTPLPNAINTYVVGPAKWVAQQNPEAVKKSAMLYNNFSTTKNQADKQVEAYSQVGYDFIYKDAANINESNWSPFVLNMKNQGVEWMTLVSSFEEIVPLQQTMAQQGYKPKVVELETNFYNQKYPADAGSVADGSLVRLTTWPVEEADKNPAMQQYLDQLYKSVPDAKPELLGTQAWSAGLLFATAAKSVGPDLTRDKLLAAAKDIHKWNGGGLHGESDPGGNVPSTCFIVMKVENGGFTRAYPLPDKDKAIYDAGNGRSCPSREEGLATLTGDYGQGAKKK